MAKFEKLRARFLSEPADFTWMELVRLLDGCGFNLDETGNGSRCKFTFKDDASLVILVHRPHPTQIIKRYIMKQIKQTLIEQGILGS